MNDEMILFDFIEGKVYEPPARTTRVREHSRVVTPRARRTDPPTAHAAAARVAPTAGARTARILAAYAEQAMTPFECAALFPDAHEATVRAAVGRLHKAGYLVETHCTRLSPSGSPSAELRLA